MINQFSCGVLTTITRKTGYFSYKLRKNYFTANTQIQLGSVKIVVYFRCVRFLLKIAQSGTKHFLTFHFLICLLIARIVGFMLFYFNFVRVIVLIVPKNQRVSFKNFPYRERTFTAITSCKQENKIKESRCNNLKKTSFNCSSSTLLNPLFCSLIN